MNSYSDPNYEESQATIFHKALKKGLNLYRSKGCDSIVAAGGGSPIDAAKAITALVTNPEKIQDYTCLGKISNPGPPAIVTTWQPMA